MTQIGENYDAVDSLRRTNYSAPLRMPAARPHSLQMDAYYANWAKNRLRANDIAESMIPESHFADQEDIIINAIEPRVDTTDDYKRSKPLARRQTSAKGRRIIVQSSRGFKSIPVEIPEEEIVFTQNKDTIPSPPPSFDLLDILDGFMQPQIEAVFDDVAKPTTTSEVTELLMLNAQADEFANTRKEIILPAPIATPAPVQAEQKQTTIPSHLRKCDCGTLFVPPHNAPNAKMCQKCYRPILQAKLQQRAQAQQPKVVAPVIVQSVESTIRTLVQSNRLSELPEGATIKSNDGRQMIILYRGKSMTIHISQPKKAPTNGRHQSFRR